jgi:5-hydroxyisourate hydrolase
MMNVGGLSIHCVDVANGRVAVGLGVTLYRLGESAPLVRGAINSKGLLDDPVLMSNAIGAGGYEVRFAVGDFYRRQGITLPTPAFLEEVPYRFHIADPTQHYHLPFKFTPWGFSLFRGGA